MSRAFLNHDLLKSFPAEEFRRRRPFQWFESGQFLTPDGFRSLHRGFPDLGLFERHSGIGRAYGQRPHDRYYLAYRESIYHRGERPSGGVVRREDLSPEWRLFIEELQTSEPYAGLIKSLFQVTRYSVRFAWHVGFAGCEVSPHVDAPEKIGTQIIYFNTSQDWDPAWGGSTLVLCDKSTDAMNPDFGDFARAIPIRNVDGNSFVFKNGREAWHGMEPLRCPATAYRRIFNIIFETPEARRGPRLMSRVTKYCKRVLGRVSGG